MTGEGDETPVYLAQQQANLGCHKDFVWHLASWIRESSRSASVETQTAGLSVLSKASDILPSPRVERSHTKSRR